jgi:hypothetical protein
MVEDKALEAVEAVEAVVGQHGDGIVSQVKKFCTWYFLEI